VALARALVIRPTVLLLDEPLSNLDLKLREEMRLEITTLQRRLGITMVMVTHDQREALAVSDRSAVMNQGRIEQLGDARAVYEHPASRFVADFIGSTNFLPGKAHDSSTAGGMCTVSTEAGELRLLAPQALRTGDMVQIAVRPKRLRFGTDTISGAFNLAGTVLRHVYLGSHYRNACKDGVRFVVCRADRQRRSHTAAVDQCVSAPRRLICRLPRLSRQFVRADLRA
jgi:ABC-type Fe3+/spermidine/putrescine transport system ATPase subunit